VRGGGGVYGARIALSCFVWFPTYNIILTASAAPRDWRVQKSFLVGIISRILSVEKPRRAVFFFFGHIDAFRGGHNHHHHRRRPSLVDEARRRRRPVFPGPRTYTSRPPLPPPTALARKIQPKTNNHRKGPGPSSQCNPTRQPEKRPQGEGRRDMALVCVCVCVWP
jgi:hypothetical protein